MRLARHRSRRRRGRGHRGRRGGGSRLCRRCRLGHFNLRLTARFEDKNRRAFRYLVAYLHLQVLHHARRRRRDFHRRLVRLERDQRLLLGDRVARLDEHFDDLDFLEVADVRNDDLIHTVVGSAFSGSMPYFLIASATVLLLPSPWSASALSAAIATKQRFTSKKKRSLARESERPKPSVPSTRYPRSFGMNGRI